MLHFIPMHTHTHVHTHTHTHTHTRTHTHTHTRMHPHTYTHTHTHTHTHHTGDCIGLPFTSEDRFPVIPPYGIPALVGWYQYPYSPPVYHPIGKYSYNPPGKKPLARSIYWLKSETGRLSLVPHNFGGVLLEMKGIPLDGVEALASTKTHNRLDPMHTDE